LEVFFESGHIVSNAPIIRLHERPDEEFPSEAERDFDFAKEGGMDYFIVAIIDHKAPRNVSLRLFSVRTQKLIQNQTFTETPARNKSEEYENIVKAVEAFVVHLER
jgi:hypothetical protein